MQKITTQKKKIKILTQQRSKRQKNNLKHKKIQKIQLTYTKYKNNTIITQTIIHPLPHPLAPLSFSPPFTITQSLTLVRAFTLPPRVINNSHTAVCPFLAAKCSGVRLSCREMRRYTWNEWGWPLDQGLKKMLCDLCISNERGERAWYDETCIV